MHPCTAASLSCGPTRFFNTCTPSSVLTHLHTPKGLINALEVDKCFPAHPQTCSAWETTNRVGIRGDMDMSTGHVWLPSVSGEKDPLISLMSEYSSRCVPSFPLSNN